MQQTQQISKKTTITQKISEFFQSMGNLFAKPRDPNDPIIVQTSLSNSQTQSLKQLFFYLDQQLPPGYQRPKLSSKYVLRGIFCPQQLEQTFGAHLAPALYNWFIFNKKGIQSGSAINKRINKKNLNPKLTKYPEVVDLNTFVISMECILRSFGYKIWLKNYDGLTALELMIIIFFSQGNREWLNRKVSIQEIRTILQLMLSLVTPHRDNRSASQVLSAEEVKEQLMGQGALQVGEEGEEEQKEMREPVSLDSVGFGPGDKRKLLLGADYEQERKSVKGNNRSSSKGKEQMMALTKSLVNLPEIRVESFIRGLLPQQSEQSSQLIDFNNQNSLINANNNSQKMRIDISDLFFHLRRSLPRLNSAIIQYFESRTILNQKFTPNPILYNPPIAPHLPKLMKSRLVHSGTLAMLYLASQRLKSVTMTRLYSSQTQGFSFNRLSYHWIGYNAPTMIVIEHRDQQTNERFIFGTYCDKQMKDKARFHGNVNNFMFSLQPVFNVFRASSSGTNYQYLNTRHIQKSVYSCGLGFGGQYSDHRLWIDADNLQKGSKLKTSDDTYQIGFIAGKAKNLNIKKIQIWGFGSRENIAHQEYHRQLEKSRKQKDRKVDKKQLLESDFDKEFLLGNTFSHNKEKEERN